MALSYAQYPALQGNFEPSRFNSEVYDCEVEGEIPADLDGVFYRVGAEWFYPPRYPDDSLCENPKTRTCRRVALVRVTVTERFGASDAKSASTTFDRWQFASELGW